MENETYSPKMMDSFVNPLKIQLTPDELRFIEDNCFYNLQIDQINKDTIAHIYDEIISIIKFYRQIDAYVLVDFATRIEDKLFKFISWEDFENKEEEKETKCSVEIPF